MSSTEVKTPQPLSPLVVLEDEATQLRTRRALEQKQGLLALEELNQAAAHLANLLQVKTFEPGDLRFGQIYRGLDKAMARIARLGTDRPFDLSGRNPIEEASRMAEFYANPANYRPSTASEPDGLVAVAEDRGKLARDFLREYGVAIHNLAAERR